MLLKIFYICSYLISGSFFCINPVENTDSELPVCLSEGGDGHQPHGVVSSQQPGQLLQPATGEQGARGGREQRGRGIAQETCQGMEPRIKICTSYSGTTVHTVLFIDCVDKIYSPNRHLLYY